MWALLPIYIALVEPNITQSPPSSPVTTKPFLYIGASLGVAGSNAGAWATLLPLGVVVGHAWPERNFAVDARLSLGVEPFLGRSWSADAATGSQLESAATGTFSARFAITPRVGGQHRKLRVHLITPLGLDITPIPNATGDRMIGSAVYLNGGVGLGVLREFGTRGLFGFDFYGFFGVNVGETAGRSDALYPRVIGGATTLVHLGGRI